jgi:hypothetical protein
VSVTSGKRTARPAADMQWRAKKIATQAAKLADQARPMTKSAAVTAKRRAGTAANWAGPKVGKARTWMAVRAARSSVSVQETVAPRVAAVLAATARRLDPPEPESRRTPKMLAGIALLAAGAAAATAMAMRNRQRLMPPMPSRPTPGSAPGTPAMSEPTPAPAAGHPAGLDRGAQGEHAKGKSGVNGLSRTR